MFMHLVLPLAWAAAATVAACQGPAGSEPSASEVTTASTAFERAAFEDAAMVEPDTSLLQHRLEVQPSDLPDVFPDIPEAASAWALWQPIADGVADPSVLVNTSTLPLPGALFPGHPWLLKQSATAIGLGYNRPTLPEGGGCMGPRFAVTPYSSWFLLYVSTPQMLPFVVPMDQPGRTDVSVLVCPGGGGEFLDWEIEGTDIAKSLNRLGISAFVLKYRVPMKAWGAGAEIMDAQRALGIVRHHAAALGLNRSRVGMFGASHGAFTATMTSFATKRLYERRDAADDWNQKPDFWLLLYPQLYLDSYRKAAAGPCVEYGVEMNGLASAPPTFIAAGADDICCPPSDMYAFHEMLKLHSKAPVELNVYSGVSHYWATCFRNGVEEMLHEACLWLLRARHFIMWNVEHKVPSEIDKVFLETIKYVNPLLIRNVSG